MGGYSSLIHRILQQVTAEVVVPFAVLFLLFFLSWPFDSRHSLEQFVFGHVERPVAFGSELPMFFVCFFLTNSHEFPWMEMNTGAGGGGKASSFWERFAQNSIKQVAVFG